MYRPRIDADLEMVTRDGVTLVGDLYRPADDGRWPVLLHRTPYDRQDSFRVSGIVADPLWLARQGFAVLVQDSRGRFDSGGESTSSPRSTTTPPTRSTGRRRCHPHEDDQPPDQGASQGAGGR